jgi:hypothetical protein
MNRNNSLHKIRNILKNKSALIPGIVIGTVYFILYLISINHLFLAVGEFEIAVIDNPGSKFFTMRAPFLWEPIASISFFGLKLFIAPLNILIGVLLSLMVMLNIAVAVFSYRCKRSCRTNLGYSFAGFLPAMLTGFACCAPTFVIALAPVLSSFTVFFVSLQPFLIPFSVAVMTLGLLWSLSRITELNI